MFFHLRKMALIALMFVSSAAFCCPGSRAWKDFSEISLTAGNARPLTMARFTDAVYVRIEDAATVKEMYQLPGGIYLFKGYDPSSPGPSPFFMLDMPVGIVLNLMAGYFPTPCAVMGTPTSFAYSNSAMSRTGFAVKGSAHTDSPSSMVFDLLAIEQQDQGAQIGTSGTLKFNDIGPLPPDTSIVGWVISRGSGSRAEMIERPPAALVFRDIEALVRSKPGR